MKSACIFPWNHITGMYACIHKACLHKDVSFAWHHWTHRCGKDISKNSVCSIYGYWMLWFWGLCADIPDTMWYILYKYDLKNLKLDVLAHLAIFGLVSSHINSIFDPNINFLYTHFRLTLTSTCYCMVLLWNACTTTVTNWGKGQYE